MIKFIHAADLHLDSPLCGLERYEGAPADQIRGATRQALEKLTELALQEQVAFIVIAGDLYDGDWKDYNTGLFLVRQMSRLREANIKVFIVSGNHDAASRITRSLRMPDNVRTFSTKKPETVILESLGIALHGQGFAEQACVKDLASGYPTRVVDHFNIGLLHTSVLGREGHETYAPCTVDTLRLKEYEYWALGHVHKREVLLENPWIVFPGNTQGRHIRETGPKGCTLVSIHDGSCVAVEHRDLHVLRWEMCAVDATGVSSADGLIDRIMSVVQQKAEQGMGELLAVRLNISGRCKAHSELSSDPVRWTNEIRAQVTDATGGDVWLEKIALQTAMEIDLDRLLERSDTLGDLLRYIHSLESGDAFFEIAKGELSPFIAKLPSEVQRGEDAVTITQERVSELLVNIKQLLIVRLLSSEGSQ